MRVFNYAEKTANNSSSIVTIGNFDGIHLGHRALINTVLKEAISERSRSALVTFDPHPQEIIHPNKPIHRIYSTKHQLHLFEELGLDEVHLIPFTLALSKMQPEEFALKFLINRFNLKKLVIGYDFRFGKHRAGDFKLLKNLSRKFNFSIEEISPVKEKGQTVSSSLIRKLIKEFNFDKIPNYLGREFSLFGKVVYGDKRGYKLGFPTANIKLENSLAIKNGVYTSKVKLSDKTHFGITNIGTKPTFGKNSITAETFIFNFEENIYGKNLEVIPLCQLRKEKKFICIEELKKQIHFDINKAEKFLIEREMLKVFNYDRKVKN